MLVFVCDITAFVFGLSLTAFGCVCVRECMRLYACVVSVQKFQSQVAVAALLLHSLLFILIVTVYFGGVVDFGAEGGGLRSPVVDAYLM